MPQTELSTDRVIDRGIEGWYRAVEICGSLADRLKIGETVMFANSIYVAVALARRTRPEADGVVVLVKPADKVHRLVTPERKALLRVVVEMRRNGSTFEEIQNATKVNVTTLKRMVYAHNKKGA